MKISRLICPALFCFFLAGAQGCTAIPSTGTQLYVSDKLNSIQNGNTPAQVIHLMDGEPNAVTSLNGPRGNFEVWEYRVGNFLYWENAVILFKDGRVFAIPKSAQELLGILYSNGVILEAQFWDQKQR